MFTSFSYIWFPISRDPPEGGTSKAEIVKRYPKIEFPISRDPPEGGTSHECYEILWG